MILYGNGEPFTVWTSKCCISYILVKLKQNILELGEAGDKHADCKTMAKQISKGQSLQYKNGLKP